MNYVRNILTTIIIGWPALIAGYLWAAVVSGFSSGAFLHERDEKAAIDKFCKKP